MLWFYSRNGESLSLETRYDNQALEYVGILTHPDNRRETRRFETAKAFRDWLVSFDQRLLAERWTQRGAPRLLPDGWPNKTPAQ